MQFWRDNEIERAWDDFEKYGSKVEHMKRVLAAPDRYTGWQFSWRALLFFVLFALPAGLVVLAIIYHALNALRGWS